MAAHAKFSPSDSHRWMNCPGALRLSEGVPNNSSDAAREGTVAHRILEHSLRFDIEPYRFEGFVQEEDGLSVEIDEDMVWFLTPIFDKIRAMPGEKFYESRVDLSRWLPDQFGTLDIGIIEWDETGEKVKRVIIDDLKYGRGIPVSPEENSQLQIYGLGFVEMVRKKYNLKFDPDTPVDIMIEQPRNHQGGGQWNTTIRDLLEFGEKVREAGKIALTGTELIPGEKQCQFCRARFKCPALWEKIKGILMMSEDGKLPAVETLSPEDVAFILDNKSTIEYFLKDVQSNALLAAKQGDAPPGYKAVEGSAGRRGWDSEKTAEDFLSEMGVNPFKPREIISPAEAEKLIKKEIPGRTKEGKAQRKIVFSELDENITTPPKNIILVPESDKRKSVNFLESVFGDLD